MRNLQPLFTTFSQTHLHSGRLKHCHFNNEVVIPYHESKFFIFQERSVFCVSNCDGKPVELINSSKLSYESSIIGLAYDNILNNLLLFQRNGAITLCKFDTERAFIERVVKVCDDIDIVECDPCFEVILMINDNKMYVISYMDLQIIRTISLNGLHEGKSVLINVGWGKKETQFHGSEGKQAAMKAEITVDPDLVKDKKGPFISWRNDGDFFAISYWDTLTNQRFIKIFDKMGALQCVNEYLPGLDGPIAWKHSDYSIAFSQRLPNKYKIGFLERNGLQHGEFSIPFSCQVKDIQWNCDSKILTTLCEDRETSSYSLYLWTSGNYHWYLKQKINFTSTLKSWEWDSYHNYRLHLFTVDGVITTAEWYLCTAYSNLNSPGWSDAAVAVIDGSNVLVTDFTKAVIPPPMCRWNLEASSSVACVIFPSWSISDNASEGHLLSIVLNNGIVQSYFTTGEVEKPRNSWTVVDEIPSNPNFIVGHWSWIASESYLTCSALEDCKYLLQWRSPSDDKLITKSSLVIGFPVLTMNYFNDTVLLQETNGQLYFVEERSRLVKHCQIPEPCQKIVFNDHGIHSLSETFRLYQDNDQIGSQITSFALNNIFLLATSSYEKLLIFKRDKEQWLELDRRSVERGSRIVVVSDDKVVFQLPRGNLETIQPRAMTVEKVREMLDEEDYRSAVHLLRQQRVDLNLIVDHNPNKFLASVSDFIEKVKAQWIILFLTELNDSSLLTDSFAHFYKKKTVSLLENKVEKVCLKVLEVLKDREDNDSLLIKARCLVKLERIDEALNLALHSEHVMQHLIVLTDVISYQQALGVYNLEAACIIAGKSQMDPKEYLPYLNSLKKMEPNYMKYKIDHSMKKPESALRHIAMCPGDDHFLECLDLIQEFSLYSKALHLFRSDTDKYKIVAERYGNMLMRDKLYEEAGVMFCRAGLPKKAVEALTEIASWRQCMIFASEFGFSDAEKEALVERLQEVLKGTQKYYEASELCLEVLNDPLLAIEMLLLGRYWKEAFYIAKTRNLEHLIDSPIKKTLLDYYESLLEDLKAHKENFKKYFDRLIVVRREKSRKFESGFSDNLQTVSDAESLSSFESSKSVSSAMSKKTKKASRKLWSLKEGNPREEQALLFSLTNLYKTIDSITGEVRGTCLSLTHACLDEEGTTLQSAITQMIDLMSSSLEIIWPKDPEHDETAALDEQLKHPPNLPMKKNWHVCILNR